jgi:hypothetical protein
MNKPYFFSLSISSLLILSLVTAAITTTTTTTASYAQAQPQQSNDIESMLAQAEEELRQIEEAEVTLNLTVNELAKFALGGGS